jgi:hypothetical protein
VRLVPEHVEDELAHLHVPLAAADLVVVVAVGGLGDLLHVGQVIAAVADGGAEQVERHANHAVGDDEGRELLADVDALEALLRRVDGAQLGAHLRVVPALPQHEQQPVRHELDVALGALGLEEALQLVVAVALGRHRPELADDRHARRGPRPVELDRGELPAPAQQRREDGRALDERVVHVALRVLDGAIRGAHLDLERPEAVAHAVLPAEAPPLYARPP